MKNIDPLKIDQMGEKRTESIITRFPNELETEAGLLHDVLVHVIPVVESYIDAPLEGTVHLEVVEPGRGSGTNPATGVIRYSLKGDETRSVRLAGEMSYQLGKILWYRGSSDANFSGTDSETGRSSTRISPWLLQTILMPLKFIWYDRNAWQTAFYKRIGLFSNRSLFNTDQLNLIDRLSEDERTLAEAQCLLHAQSFSQRFPKWQSDMSRMLSIDFSLSGDTALELITETPIEAWETRFRSDVIKWIEHQKNTETS